ncbi:MAG: hypothetical protein HYV09_19875 [Deltaproteobacteria bacterium]|nr:hypothetical protein [Deltaproteobacteria bacterium]
MDHAAAVSRPLNTYEEFAELLVREVRDAAIQGCDGNLRSESPSPVARRWRAAAAGGTDAALPVAIPDCVDETIFYLLHAIDEGSLRLSFTASSGRTVDLTEEGLGELSGWFMGSEGWRRAYSEERFADDAAGLSLD